MVRLITRRGRAGDSSRRVAALLAACALLAQGALPSLHARHVGRTVEPALAATASSSPSAPQLTARTTRLPAHDESDCPVCRSLLQVRHFLAAPRPAPAATLQVQPRDARPIVAVVSATTPRATPPRGPPLPA